MSRVTPPTCKADLFAGGRVRRKYQRRVWAICSKAAVDTDVRFDGSMGCSRESHTVWFLDGAASDRRGYFDASCGQWLAGQLAKAFVVYRLGGDARKVFGDPLLPSLRSLQRLLRAQHQLKAKRPRLAGRGLTEQLQ